MHRGLLVLAATLVVIGILASYAYAAGDMKILKYKVGIRSYAIVEKGGRRMILRGHKAEELLKRMGIIQEKYKKRPSSIVKAAKKIINAKPKDSNTAEQNVMVENNAPRVAAKHGCLTCGKKPRVPDKKMDSQKTQNKDEDRLGRIEKKLDIIIKLLKAILKALGGKV